MWWLVATLARLVETFHDIEGLSGKYDLVQQSGTKKRNSLRRLFGLRRPSPAQGSSAATAQNSPITIDYSILESSTVSDPNVMTEELKKLQKAASDVQEQLSTVMKFRWAMADQGKADDLVKDLSMYNESLERYVTPLGISEPQRRQ